MPNNITNVLRFHGEEDAVKELFTNLSTKTGDDAIIFPDFNKIVEMPKSLDVESGSDGAMGLFILTGKKDSFPVNGLEILSGFQKLDKERQEEVLSIGRKYAENLENYGHTTWYDWSIQNWGTKWNAYNCRKISQTEFSFQTAWSNVTMLINIISKKYPSIKIEYTYADEDTGYNVGYFVFLGGEIQERNTPDGGSKEAYDLCFSIDEDSKEYYELIDGNWEYKEDE